MRMRINLKPPGPPEPRRFCLFDMGFRPFFLGAAVVAVVWMALWLLAIRGLPVDSYYGTFRWHAHEMLFGYAVAVIAGFLLTAVENWTDVPTPKGAALAGLFLLWAAARVTGFLPDLVPPRVNAVLDLTFLPALGVALALPVFKGGSPGNAVFLAILGLLAAANLLVHLDILGAGSHLAPRGTVLGLGVIVLAIAIIGGRVFPRFTARIPGVTPKVRPWLEAAALGTLVLFLAAALSGPASRLTGAAALAAGLCHAARLAGWYDRRVWGEPLVWVLHTGYAWMAAGLLLWGAAAFGAVPHTVAVHAMTAGGIGVLTVGMMARVALGHTDRPVTASAPVTAAFVLLNLAALVRVGGPLAVPGRYNQAMATAGALWLMAFVLFLAVYAPILVGPGAVPDDDDEDEDDPVSGGRSG
jgi:uncharacterized protein involved in response to NO